MKSAFFWFMDGTMLEPGGISKQGLVEVVRESSFLWQLLLPISSDRENLSNVSNVRCGDQQAPPTFF